MCLCLSNYCNKQSLTCTDFWHLQICTHNIKITLRDCIDIFERTKTFYIKDESQLDHYVILRRTKLLL
jgi:hypothetical protein